MVHFSHSRSIHLKMNRISSFAVIDLETSTLPDLNFNKANITELSIHGFASDIIRSGKEYENLRINHKLTLLFNPRMLIDPNAEKITGLNNYTLENESYFNANAANVIIGFLKHLRQPVCLVAHNGNKFDFPVLKQALDKLKMELPSDVLCIDSLVAIKELENPKDYELIDDEEESGCIPLVESVSNITPLKEDSFDKQEVQVAIEETIGSTQDNVEVDKITGLAKVASPDWQKLNETTPKRSTNISLTNNCVERNGKRKLKDDESPNSTAPKSRRSLFTPTKFEHNKLTTIYERLFDQAPNVAHHAEADVITLEKIMFFFGKSFVEYAEANAVPFSKTKNLGARQ